MFLLYIPPTVPFTAILLLKSISKGNQVFCVNTSQVYKVCERKAIQIAFPFSCLQIHQEHQVITKRWGNWKKFLSQLQQTVQQVLHTTWLWQPNCTTQQFGDVENDFKTSCLKLTVSFIVVELIRSQSLMEQICPPFLLNAFAL